VAQRPRERGSLQESNPGAMPWRQVQEAGRDPRRLPRGRPEKNSGMKKRDVQLKHTTAAPTPSPAGPCRTCSSSRTRTSTTRLLEKRAERPDLDQSEWSGDMAGAPTTCPTGCLPAGFSVLVPARREGGRGKRQLDRPGRGKTRCSPHVPEIPARRANAMPTSASTATCSRMTAITPASAWSRRGCWRRTDFHLVLRPNFGAVVMEVQCMPTLTPLCSSVVNREQRNPRHGDATGRSTKPGGRPGRPGSVARRRSGSRLADPGCVACRAVHRCRSTRCAIRGQGSSTSSSSPVPIWNPLAWSAAHLIGVLHEISAAAILSANHVRDLVMWRPSRVALLTRYPTVVLPWARFAWPPPQGPVPHPPLPSSLPLPC